tara:strand:+ start:69 stop:437 length:369 start_codon:yes stop_codon:yes gene_type:complete
MTNKKTTSGKGGSNKNYEPNIAPSWSYERVAAESQALFDTYKDMLEKPDGKVALLRELCEQRAVMYQLIEAFEINRQVSSGAATNSHLAVTKFEEIEQTVKSQGKSFSKRLEHLEEYKKRGL